MKYGDSSFELNKNCLIIIDEAQDLGPEYIEAICSIMRNTYIDTYVIGDKLQSIWGDKNIHTLLEDPKALPNTNIIKNNGKNIVKRFHNEELKILVNKIVKFEKYKLPEIENICDGNCKYEHDNILPYDFIQTEPIYTSEQNEDKINKIIEKIIKIMDDEIKDNK
jgi:hypothetical protein